jgi:hypothetical protein
LSGRARKGASGAVLCGIFEGGLIVAVSLNLLIRQRKKVVDNLYQAYKLLDNHLEISERYLKRIKARKRNVPDDDDLLFLTEQTKGAIDLLDAYVKLLNQGWEHVGS